MNIDDLNLEELGALTEDQVKAYCTHALMEEGVIETAPPELLDATSPEVPMTTFYEPQENIYSRLGFAFRTAEDAQAFLDLQPVKVDSDWPVKQEYAKPMSGYSVKATQLCSEPDYIRLKSLLKAAEENKEVNEKARTKFDQDQKAVTNVTDSIRQRWIEARDAIDHLDRIRATFEEYLVLCNGNERPARTFLEKACGLVDVQKAIGDRGNEAEMMDMPVVRALEKKDPNDSGF